MADVEVSREIHASPEAVWNAITDVTRMGEWSPECHTCTWDDGATGPAEGVTFTGHNKHGEFDWTTQAVIVACEPHERFAFDGFFGDLHFAKWAYLIEPTGDGCRVTETWSDGRPEEIIALGEQISGVADRAEHNRSGMEQTLARLAAAVETSS